MRAAAAQSGGARGGGPPSRACSLASLLALWDYPTATLVSFRYFYCVCFCLLAVFPVPFANAVFTPVPVELLLFERVRLRRLHIFCDAHSCARLSPFDPASRLYLYHPVFCATLSQHAMCWREMDQKKRETR